MALIQVKVKKNLLGKSNIANPIGDIIDMDESLAQEFEKDGKVEILKQSTPVANPAGNPSNATKPKTK